MLVMSSGALCSMLSAMEAFIPSCYRALVVGEGLGSFGPLWKTFKPFLTAAVSGFSTNVTHQSDFRADVVALVFMLCNILWLT